MIVDSFVCVRQSGNMPSIISSRWDSVIDITSPVDCPFVMKRHLPGSVSIKHAHSLEMTVLSSHLFQIEEEATEDSLMRTIMGSIQVRFVVLVNPFTYFGMASMMVCGARVGTIRVTLRSAASSKA